MQITSARILCAAALSVFVGTGLFAGPPADTRLEIVGPTEPLRNGDEFGARVLLDTMVDGVQGWSLGIRHDPSALELLGAVEGELTATVADGLPPQFLVVDAEPRGEVAGVTMAVVISFTQPITVDIGDDYEILTMDYRVIADPTTGDPPPVPCVDIETALSFSDEVNVPPVSSVLTVNGQTATPELVDLPITVSCPGTLEFTSCVGDTENIYLQWEFSQTPWDFLFLYRDGDLLAQLEPDVAAYTDEGLEPGEYHYTIVGFAVERPDEQPQMFWDYCSATVIPVTIQTVDPQIGYYLGGETITITGTAFSAAEATSLEFFAEGEEPLPVTVLEVLSDTEMTATVPASPRLGSYSLRLVNDRGSAEFADAYAYGFIRGEANGDGAIDLSDGINILAVLFLGEGELACFDAADATDDGQLDVSDGIRIFGYLFLGGEPPAAPFPDPGFDETDDAFGCLEEADAA